MLDTAKGGVETALSAAEARATLWRGIVGYLWSAGA